MPMFLTCYGVLIIAAVAIVPKIDPALQGALRMCANHGKPAASDQERLCDKCGLRFAA